MLKLIILLTLFFNQLFLTVSIIVHPKGPTHRTFATKCIEQITEHAYKYATSKNHSFSHFLLTYIITRRLNTPGYEIQEDVLKILHKQSMWSIEVLQYGRKDFRSYSENCITNGPFDPYAPRVRQPVNCSRKHVMSLKTHLYVMVVEELEIFYDKLDRLVNTSSYNSEASFIIYYMKIGSISYSLALKIISALYYNYSIRNLVVMVPTSVTKFGMYVSNMENEIGKRCYSRLSIKMPFQCNEGKLISNGNNIFKEHRNQNYFKCFVNMHALPYEPFIISQTSGIESDVIKEMGEALNISFRILINPEATTQLGEKNYDGTWSGFLQPVFSDWDLGIGSVAPEIQLIHDFTNSVGYHWVRLVYIIPIAAIIPRWRVLTVIFTTEMWGICLAVIFGFAIAFYVFRSKREAKTFKTFEKCMNAALQVLIAHPLSTQPISNFTRVYCISLAVFGIIINSVYTSSLIYYLQNPIREHQITTNIEIAQHNLSLGASSKFKEMFKYSSSKYAKMILDSYQTVNESLDTYSYWLKKVSTDRNMATIATRLYVYYLISQHNPIVTDRHGDSKVFIAPKPLRSQQIGIIMRKGNFLEDEINKIIQKLILEAGLIKKIKSHYMRGFIDTSEKSPWSDSDDNDEDGDDDDPHGISSLSPYHLEGAFVLLALGGVCGLLALVIEIAYCHIERSCRKEKK